MKEKTKLMQKTVRRKKKKPRDFSWIWRVTRLVSSSFVKVSCLLIGLAIISLSFLAGYQYLLNWPYLKLEGVEITGVDFRTKHELLKMSRLNTSMSLLALNMKEIKKNLERHPWVRLVKLEKRFPHTLVIEVEEEEPWAVVLMDKLYYMDRWGKIFKAVEETENVDYPIITGIPSGAERQKGPLKMASDILRILEKEEDVWNRKDISEIHVEEAGHVCLYFSSMPAVVKLNGREADRKVDDLKKVLAHLKKTGRVHLVKAINLHYAEGAVVSFKNS
jgi:cell division protein FtsQ